MGINTAIEWCDHTFNPWWGCTNVSPGCDHCFAESFAKRVGYSETGSQFPIWGKDSQRRFFGDKHWEEPLKWDRDAEKVGVRRRVFCASMCDVMEDRPDFARPRDRLWELIRKTPNLDWLLLTKRPQNYRKFMPWTNTPWENVWGGTTVESSEFLWRADALIAVPFAIRFISQEPQLAPIDWSGRLQIGEEFLTSEGLLFPRMSVRRSLNQIIVGGESGPGARPFDLEWARETIRQCRAAGLAVFYKQGGTSNRCPHDSKGGCQGCMPPDLRVREFPR